MDDEDYEAIEEAELTTLEEIAVLTHEIYEAYQKAGFTARQALWLAATQHAGLELPED